MHVSLKSTSEAMRLTLAYSAAQARLPITILLLVSMKACHAPS